MNSTSTFAPLSRITQAASRCANAGSGRYVRAMPTRGVGESGEFFLISNKRFTKPKRS